MKVSNTGGSITTAPLTSNPSVPITLPLHRRHEMLHYESDDGNAGCVAFPVNYEQLYNLKGRLLTLIDATYTDPVQRKAQKDIVWQTVQVWMQDIEREGGYESLPLTLSDGAEPQA